MERGAGGAHTQGTPVVGDRVFVAVDEENGSSALLWALRNLAMEGTMVAVAHVHCPAQSIPVNGVQVHHTQMNPQVVDAYGKKERVRVEKKLDEYGLICRRQMGQKFRCWKITIVKDEVAKGLEELIDLHGITKLVVGAAPDERYSDALFSWEGPWSKTARSLTQAASNSCKIWFTCKGQLICTRERNENYFAMPPSPIEEALREAQHLREKLSEEATKRQKAEIDLVSALGMIGEWRMLHQQEMCQREAIEEQHLREKQEVREMIKRFEAVYHQLDDAQELKLRMIEMESARKDHREDLAMNKYRAESLQADNEKLQQELNRCITEMESARKEFEEELATSKYLVELLQSDKEKLQQELHAALTEAEDLRGKSLLSSTSEPDNTSTPSYFVCPISQEVMNDPHVAADGFTYEAEEIRGWLDSGHDTSPMTNLKLSHSVLTPNRALRSAILEWQQQQQHWT
ncbi:unnamed protein product [Urochloa decumbens]|uniref:RING-type E3 ubiquitin transferase n=1 Tax=Urochloa decumbens TaxID=240449 RepID=A0ABC8V934_9POAL